MTDPSARPRGLDTIKWTAPSGVAGEPFAITRLGPVQGVGTMARDVHNSGVITETAAPVSITAWTGVDVTDEKTVTRSQINLLK